MTAARPVPPEAEIRAIVGHTFPGGMVHPVVLFHMPILGSKTTIGEMFALGQAESDFSIGIESYDWEMFAPLKEDVAYGISGKIVSAERRTSRNDRPYDCIQFQFEVAQPDGALAARTTITWHYRRGVL